MTDIPKTLAGVTPSVGEIRINPFLLQVRGQGLLSRRAPRVRNWSVFAVVRRLRGFFALAPRLYLRQYRHRLAFRKAVIFKDGRLNLAQLSPAPSPKPQPKSNEPIPALRIGSFKVTQGFLSFDDRRRPSDFATRLEPINFELQNFTTGWTGAASLSPAHRSSASVSSGMGTSRSSPSSPTANCKSRAAGAHDLGVSGRSAELSGQLRKNRCGCDLSIRAERMMSI